MGFHRLTRERVSAEPIPSHHSWDDHGRAVIAAALAAGVTLLDTADAYCHDEHDVGHNERLIAAVARGARAASRS